MAVKTYSKGSNMSLSTNFEVSEFACHGSGCCSTVLIDDELVKYLQTIRDHFKKPITVTSGYRCTVHNRNVGGATGSRHAKGQAADIVVKDVTPAEVAKYAESIGILGIGLYETSKDGHFVHIDTRTTKAFWYGQGQAYRSTFGGKAPEEPSTPTVPSVKPTTSASGKYELKDFVKDIQKVFGTAVDGIAGPITLSKTRTLSASINATHNAVMLVQKRLDTLGYTEVGKADGVAGSKFTAAVKHFQKDNGCVVDGEITSGGKTWKKLLGMK
jgi:peptidoglycan hydrolase-like protein with peptidoglycan-binding domain